MINIEDLQKLCKENKIEWSLHSLKRIRERNIKASDVINCIASGVIIEQYPNDRPLPSCLIYGKLQTRHLHTVVASDGNRIYIITAYVPSSEEWEADYKTRKDNV